MVDYGFMMPYCQTALLSYSNVPGKGVHCIALLALGSRSAVPPWHHSSSSALGSLVHPVLEMGFVDCGRAGEDDMLTRVKVTEGPQSVVLDVSCCRFIASYVKSNLIYLL